ncbi:procollagen-proline dioxygenase-like protein [Emiliania huxleyi CCMP1516]|uniref:Fe2OG dioxygenase domain-containing protein n=2 Tax=Emiliania huxleyi TaxID=2903 RepID=A0A0D3I359_EMIH1|nr:procollagen-proline dioxygenase-like protein [Emiliania huxleyi CCMP1516]EOD05694.1 procollagen-proline dioxygenase-like protein [Emiliania huxleyi CCMP1516]|eukprot:XP_005758123.1 procollagen-proline dioxygenase-like protein [Emiliania huxleyi CCMP1516]
MLRQLAWRGAARLRAPFPRQPLPAAALDSLERLGYAVVPGWLRAADTAALLADALALEAAGVPRAAGVGGVAESESSDWAVELKTELRRAASVWIHEPPLSLHGAPAARLALLSTAEALRAELLDAGCTARPLDTEATSLAYLYYPAGGFYRRHRDTPPAPSPTGEHREVSLLLYLDPVWRPDWGGALRIFAKPAPVDVQPEAGTLVLMHSPLLEHEVLETSRARHCVVGWLCSVT